MNFYELHFFAHHIFYLFKTTGKDSVGKNHQQQQQQQEKRRKGSRNRVKKVPWTPTVNINLKRTNQVTDLCTLKSPPQKEGGRKKLRQSKTPAAINVLKNMIEIKNDDKENQNPSEVSYNGTLRWERKE